MIQSVKYVSVLCLKEDKPKLISALQECGEMMLCESSDSVRNTSDSAEKLRRIENLRESIKQFEKKKPLFAQPPEVDISKLKDVEEENVISTDEVEATVSDISDSEALLIKTNSLLEELLPWKNLTVKPKEINSSFYVKTVLGRVRTANYNDLLSAVQENEMSADKIYGDANFTYVVIVFMNGSSISCLEGTSFEQITLPDIEGTVDENIEYLLNKTNSLVKHISDLKEDLTRRLENDRSADLLYEQYKAEIDRETAPVILTDETAIVEGWVPVDRLDKVKKAVGNALDVYCIEDREPYDDEDPPAVLRNNKIVSQFESITTMFSPVRYRGVDPNSVMAPCYWIIFGLMMGDAGYGLMMVVFGLLLKKFMKPKGNTLGLFNVIIYSSITSIIAGVVFGSYFGEELFPPLLFSSMNEPIKMLIFTMVVGALHIILALITSAYYKIKAGNVWDGILDSIPWILTIVGIGFLFIPSFDKVGIVLIAVGMGTVLFTGGRAKPTVFGKITGGLLALYDITSYMSDILSYSRILALGLATGVVGMVMNMLAKMLFSAFSGPAVIIGAVGAGVIYIVGHVFNLALGLLSAYVHDCRLQYIEFYGKFYEGEGVLFDAFSIKPKLVSIKNNNNNTEE